MLGSHLLLIAALHGSLGYIANQFVRHGYLVLFALVAAESFAFPLPGELSLLVGAYLAWRGKLDLTWVIVVGAAAAISGDNLAYLLGRTFGQPLIERLRRLLHLHGQATARLDRYFARHGGLTVLVARQISPVRGLAALSAGVARMPWRRFVLFNGVGSILWATTVTIVAYYSVRHLDELADDFGLGGLAAVGLLAAVAVALLWVRLKRRSARRAAAEQSRQSQERQEVEHGEQSRQSWETVAVSPPADSAGDHGDRRAAAEDDAQTRP
jgi:membrane protein DedA with SNARE-associated domain